MGDFVEDLLIEHENWLREHSATQTGRWGALAANNREAAATEAATRRLLANESLEVEPGGEPPDFICRVRDWSFAVECTNIGEEAATRGTGYPADLVSGKSGWYKPLTRSVIARVKKKSACLDALAVPAVVVVGTLHAWGARTFRTQLVETMMHGPLSVTAGPKGVVVRALAEESLFVKRRPQGYEIARQNVSAVLGVGILSSGIKAIGMLHPDPQRPFDPSWMPGVPFCRFRAWPCELAELEWVQGTRVIGRETAPPRES